MPYSAAEMYPDSQRKRLGTSRLVSTLFLPLAWMILVPSLRTWACPESTEAALLTHSFARLPESHGNTGESQSTEHHHAGLVPSWFSSSGLVRAQNRRLHPQPPETDRHMQASAWCRPRPRVRGRALSGTAFTTLTYVSQEAPKSHRPLPKPRMK